MRVGSLTVQVRTLAKGIMVLGHQDANRDHRFHATDAHYGDNTLMSGTWCDLVEDDNGAPRSGAPPTTDSPL